MKSGRTRREEGVRKIEKEEQSTIAVLFLVLLLVSLPLFFFFDFARDTIPKLAANYTANIYAEQSERERERGRRQQKWTEKGGSYIRRIAFIIRLQDSRRERGSCEHDTRQ